jgi:REP element-mobilizing transposase RayT
MDGFPRSRDLRKGRISIPGQTYLITSVIRGRTPVFGSLKAGRVLVQAMRRQQLEGSAETLAYVVMPDHLHWLMVLGMQHNLSSVLRSLKANSAHGIRALGPSFGEFAWQPGFHDRALRREEDLKAVARYVVANPLRAGLVSVIGQYSLWDAVWL